MATQEKKLLTIASQLVETLEQRVAIFASFAKIANIDDPVFFGVLRKRLEKVFTPSPTNVFELKDHQICYLLEPNEAARINAALTAISDRLISHGKAPISLQPFQLPRQSKEFLQKCTDLLTASQIRSEAPKAEISSEDQDLDYFLTLEEGLHNADIASLIREQPIYDFSSQPDPGIFARELFCSIDEIEEIYKIPIRHNSWLLSRVTELLDIRMLSHLWHSYKFDKDFVAVNLHMSTILDQEFDTFTRSAGYEWQGKLVVEMPFFEVSEDLKSFSEALDILASHHCLAALDDVPVSELPAMEQHADRLFSIKLRWTAEMSRLPADQVDTLKKTLQSLEKCHLVLTHCETEAAVQAGLDLGFKLIQGRGVDKKTKSLRQDRIDANRASDSARNDAHKDEGDGISGFLSSVSGMFGSKGKR